MVIKAYRCNPVHDRPLPRREPCEEDGDRDRLSPSQHFQANAEVQVLLSLTGSAARSSATGISITLDVDFCVEAPEEALTRYGKQEIFITDQRSQFTSQAFTGVLRRKGIALSMDRRGAWRDNVVRQRRGRTLKYKEG